MAASTLTVFDSSFSFKASFKAIKVYTVAKIAPVNLTSKRNSYYLFLDLFGGIVFGSLKI